MKRIFLELVIYDLVLTHLNLFFLCQIKCQQEKYSSICQEKLTMSFSLIGQQLILSLKLFSGDPKSLINVLYLNNTMHFGMRSRAEHVSLRWGDVQQKVTSTGEEYLEYRERSTKTRTGVTSESRSFAPKMFENRGTYCQIYETFIC